MKLKCPGSRASRFLCAAALLSIPFLVAHLLGFRRDTSVLSGTASFGALRSAAGLAYITAYLLFVVCAPILAIAAGLAGAVEAVKRARRRPRPRSEDLCGGPVRHSGQGLRQAINVRGRPTGGNNTRERMPGGSNDSRR